MGDRDLLKWGRLSNFLFIKFYICIMYSLKNIYTIILIFFYLFNKVKYNLIRVQYSKGGFNRDADNKNSYNSICSF